MPERPPTPLLDRLRDMMTVEPQSDGTFLLYGAQSEEFTAEEMTMLAGELLALAATASIT